MKSNRTGISARVIADSIHDGSRLTTMEVTFPRFVLAEFNTHRVLSRNSASSRAIPVWKRLDEILSSPFIPFSFGKNKAGMQAAEEVSDEDGEAAKMNWLVGRDTAILQAFMLAGGEDQIVKDAKGNERAVEVCARVLELGREYPDFFTKMQKLSAGVHKQHANRVLEPYAWHTVIVTGTRWRNFYALRASPMAQPEIRKLAVTMARVHMENVPRVLEHGEWHLPYIFDEDWKEIGDPLRLARVSSGRCARVSYLTHDGKRSIDADFSLADNLQRDGHPSPFEHQATTHDTTGSQPSDLGGNFGKEWKQHRKMLENEHDFSALVGKESFLAGLDDDKKLQEFVLSLAA